MKALAKRIGLALDDRLNAVMVKELRQAVRARFIVGILLLFLAGQLAVVGIAILGSSDLGADLQPGSGVFSMLYGVLAFACLVCVPAYCGMRMDGERSETNIDLMFTTTLKPRAIVWGKLLSGMILAAFFASVCVPFMTFTYLLRGIDLPTISILLLFGAGVTAAAVQGALFLAALPLGRAFKGLLKVGGGLMLIWATVMVLDISDDLIRSGVGSRMGDGEFWVGFGCAAAALLLPAWVVFEVCAATLAPPAANRAFGPRLAITVGWLASGVVVLVAERWLPYSNYWRIWTTCHFLLLSLALLVGVSEREEFGPRILRRAPRHFILRQLAYLFTSGSAPAVLWTTLLALGTFAVEALWSKAKGSHAYFEEFVYPLGTFWLYSYCYSLTALLLWRWTFKRWFPKRATGAIAVILCAAVIVVPFVFFAIFDSVKLDHLGRGDLSLIGNPLMVFSEKHLQVHFMFAGFWAALVTLLNLPAFLAQWRTFKRPEAGDQGTEAGGQRPKVGSRRPEVGNGINGIP